MKLATILFGAPSVRTCISVLVLALIIALGLGVQLLAEEPGILLDDSMALANPLPMPALAAELPLPRIPAGPIVLRPARALQVSFTAVTPTKATVLTAPTAETSAKPAVALANISEPAAGEPKAAAPKALASPVPSPVPSPSASPKASPAPKPSVAPKVSASVVKAPVPIQRTTAPVTLAAPAPSPSPSPSAKPAASLAPVSDPASLPDYKLVQLPAQSPLPAPVASLPVANQEITGTQGQTVSVRLNGRGWMFTGTGKTPAGVSFMEKTVQQDAEQFRFRLDETGRLSLQFQRQDVSSGLMERQVAGLTVVARGASLASPTVTVAANTDASQYQPEYPVYQERTLVKASLPPAKTGVASSAAVSVPAAASQSASPVEAVPSDAAGLLALAKRREQAGQNIGAIELYDRLLKDFPGTASTDEVLFRLAKILESAGDGRNLKRSYDTYVRLQNEYPYSSFTEQAKERARYINRTYFRQ